MNSQTGIVALTEVNEAQKNFPSTSTNTNEHLVLHLRPSTSTNTRRVTFTTDTVDNEHLGRLKSNCCCIYTRPHQWDDPSTWEQDEHETEHCRGHTIPIEPEEQKPKPDEENPRPEDEHKDDIVVEFD